MSDFRDLVVALQALEMKKTVAGLRLSEDDLKHNVATFDDYVAGRSKGTLFFIADPITAAAEGERIKQRFQARHAQNKSGLSE